MIVKNLLYDFANCVSFGISLLSIYALLDYYIYTSTYLIALTSKIVILQCAYDMFFWHNSSSVIHHIFLLLLGSFLHQQNITYDDSLFLIIPLLSTEISTLFLSIRHWFEQLDMTKSVWYRVNNGFFVVTFLITRIYIYTTYVIYNPETYLFVESLTKHNINDRIYFYIGIFGLYALNIYWATLILKILMKPLRDLISRDYYEEHVICIAPIINVFMTMYACDFELNAYVIGTILLAISAMTLYYFIYYIPQSPYIMALYLLNQLCLQILSILSVFTICGTYFGHMSLSYHLYYLTLSIYNINSNLMAFDFSEESILCTYYITLSMYILKSELVAFAVCGKNILCILLPFMVYNYFWEAVPMNILILLACLMLTRYSKIIWSVKQSDVLVFPIVTDVCTIIIVSMSDWTTRLDFALVAYCLFLLIYIKPFYSQNTLIVCLVSFMYGSLLVNLK
jgi:hypothetical protein